MTTISIASLRDCARCPPAFHLGDGRAARATFTVSADSRFSANSNEMRCGSTLQRKVDDRLAAERRHLLIGRSDTSLNGSAVSRMTDLFGSCSSPVRSLPRSRRSSSDHVHLIAPSSSSTGRPRAHPARLDRFAHDIGLNRQLRRPPVHQDTERDALGAAEVGPSSRARRARYGPCTERLHDHRVLVVRSPGMCVSPITGLARRSRDRRGYR